LVFTHIFCWTPGDVKIAALSLGRGLAIKNLTPTRPEPIAHKIMPGVQQKIWNMLSP
jgi:hypothetical protein